MFAHTSNCDAANQWGSNLSTSSKDKEEHLGQNT